MYCWTRIPAWARPMPGRSGSCTPSARSSPAQNPVPAPVSTITRQARSSRSRVEARRTARRAASAFIALRRSGRLSGHARDLGRAARSTTTAPLPKSRSLIAVLLGADRTVILLVRRGPPPDARPAGPARVRRVARTTPRSRARDRSSASRRPSPTSAVVAQRRQHLEQVGVLALRRASVGRELHRTRARRRPSPSRAPGSPRGARSARARSPWTSRPIPGCRGSRRRVSPTSAR